jgi:hypothetical protein
MKKKTTKSSKRTAKTAQTPKPSRFPIPSIWLIFLILMAAYVTYNLQIALDELSYTRPDIEITTCLGAEQLKDIIESDVPHTDAIDAYQADPGGGAFYSWRPSTEAPFRQYTAAIAPYMISYMRQSAEKTDAYFQENALEPIVGAGFVLDEANSIPYELSKTIIYSYARYAFTRAGERYVVTVDSADYQVKNNKQIDLPQGSSSITIECGIADAEYDQVYDGISEKNSKLTPRSMMAIWEMKDNAVMLDRSEYPGGFGMGEWWVNVNGEWKQVYTGQDSVPCDVIEAEGVGTGLRCYDMKLGKDRTVK